VDLVRDGENGFVFESEDMDSLYQKISELVGQPNLWKKMGARSFELIGDFRFERIVDAVETLVANPNPESEVHA
jgi:glycosyltransferase involved in cell wall biosynthesis